MNQVPVEITAFWKGGLTFVGQNASGGTVQMGILDGKPGVGPMQLLLVAVSGCTGEDILSILQKKRAKITDMQVKVRGTRATDFPMVWTDIHITYLLWGEGIKPKDVEQAIELSEKKYCSVGIMLGKTSKITSEYRILNPGEAINITKEIGIMSEPITVTDAAFEKMVLQNPRPVIVDFWAPWCGPCKMVTPMLEKIAVELGEKLIIAKVNTDENPDWATKYGVQGIPTMLFVFGGKIVHRQVGALPERMLREAVTQFMEVTAQPSK